MNRNKRIAATVYSLGTLFVSVIYAQIPCIKEIMTIIIIINWSEWNYFKIIQKIREQHSRKPRS
jgi:hypothetical protein